MFELEKKLCIVSVATLQDLFEYGSDVVGLYMFYYKQCKIQQTNQSRTLDTFILKKLGRGKSRLRNARKILTDKKLIEIVQSRGEGGVFGKSYVKLNYIRSESSSERETQNPPTVVATSGGDPINALSVKTINALSVKKGNIDLLDIGSDKVGKKGSGTSGFFENDKPLVPPTPFFTKHHPDEKINEKIVEFIENRKQLKKKMTKIAINRLILKIDRWLIDHKPDDIVSSFDKAIDSGRQTIYEPKPDTKSGFKAKLEYEKPSSRESFNFLGE